MNINYTEQELQIIFAALMSYGDKLSTIAKEIPNEQDISDKLANKANEAWELAVEIAKVLN